MDLEIKHHRKMKIKKNLSVYFCILILLIYISSLSGESFAPDSSGATYINITGRRSFSFNAKYLLGGNAPPGFYPMSIRDDYLDIKVKGRLKGKIGIEGSVVDSKYPVEGSGLAFILRGSNFEAHFGDYDAGFEGTEFVLKDRSLTGVKGKAGYKNIEVEGLYSVPRGQTQRMRIQGDGTQGPFQLEYIPVVYGSERVKVGRGLALAEIKKGIDYEIDYMNGTITFLKRVIKVEETLEIEYESQPGGALKSSLWGLHSTVKANERGHFGVSYLEEKDRLGGLSPSDTIEFKPSGQKIAGIDGGVSFGELLKINSEVCGSQRRPNLFTNERNKGYAYRLETESKISEVDLSSYFKRIEPGFEPIGKTGYGSNTIDWGLDGSYKPVEPLTLSSSFRNLREKERKEIDRSGDIDFSPEGLFSLNYGYIQEDETEVSSKRLRKAHTGRLNKELKYVRIGTKYSRDKNTFFNNDSVLSYVSHIVGGDIGTVGFSKVSASLNAETDRRSNNQKINTGGINLSFTPSSNYALSSNGTIIKDSKEGETRMLNFNYRVRPKKYVNSQGKYSIEALRRGLYSAEPVETHTGSFRNELKPHKIFTFIYVPNLKFTRLKKNKMKIYNSLSNQYQTQIRPAKYISGTYIYETRKVLSFNEKEPYDKVADNRNNNKRTEIRLAPLAFISITTKYSDERGKGLYRTFIPQGQDTAADTLIQYKQENRFTFDNDLNVRVHRKATVILGYTFENYLFSIPDSTPTRTRKYIFDTRLNQEINNYLSIYLLSSYERKRGQDPFITGQNPDAIVYTFTPGAGFVARIGNAITSDIGYKFAKSSGDAFTYKETFNLTININLKLVTLSMLTEYNKSRDPDYKTLEGSLNLNIMM
ncbi:MAG: hypothetical protein E3J87_02145 [Candidatus Cloacimonadota bacterium]|nr:MAG: hypothetical protein E3J87_02145 [Candidatus Cloacimonadota bacterium]